MNNIVANVATGIPAKFHVVQKSMPYAYDKSIIDYITLTIGSKESTCINLTIPVRDTTKHISLDHIDASKSGKSCTIDDVEIRGQKTKDMFYFAATLLKTLTHKTIVEFTDESHFPCNISDTEIRNIPLNTSYLMFYGKTWYGKQFNAMLVDLADQEKYARLQARRNDPSYKPASFNFKSPSLNEALMPLYIGTNTWADFFNAIEREYKDKKCKMTYLWLADAVRTLTVGGNDIFGFQLWMIDISNMPLIYYAPLRIYKRGARRQTRKYTNLSNPMRDKIPRGDDYKLFDYSSSS